MMHRRNTGVGGVWTVRATPVDAAGCPDADMLQASQDQNTTVAPDCRGSKQPAAITPVGREKPARIAAWALLTVLGLLISSVIQRPVRLSLRTHDPQLPGNNGLTAPPTAAGVWAWFAPVAVVP